MGKSEFNHYSNTHLNIQNMSQYLKVDENHVDVVNHLIYVFERECPPEEFASCLEDLLFVYARFLASNPDLCFTKNDADTNLFYLTGLAKALRQPRDNHFFQSPYFIDNRLEMSVAPVNDANL